MKMNTFGFAVMGLAAACAAAAQADGWRFSAGPAWRSRVEVKTSGSASAPADIATGSRTTAYDYDMDDRREVPDPSSTDPADTLWSVGATRTETIRSPGANRVAFADSDDPSALGLNLSAGYDVYSGDWFSVGLGLRFAAYFDMKAASSRFLDTGSTRTVVTAGRSTLETPWPPTPPTAADIPAPGRRDGLFTPGHVDSDKTVYGAGSRLVTARYRADLYQLAFGPNVTWHALSWLDAYAGVEAILNLAAVDFDANRSSTTRTDCLLGFGGHVGLEARLTEHLGLYGQVGYEWVDRSDVSTGGIDADADFSSLVVSAGVCFRF